MTRIAVVADLHGNLDALEAVLAEAAGSDLLVVNGDLADGPFPSETLDRLMALGDRALGLRGNGDRWLLDACEGRYQPRDPGVDDLIRWVAGRLTPAQRAYLAALSLRRTLDHPRLGRLGFCHATARSDNEMLLVDATLDHARAALAGLDAPTVFLGHSHMPFDRLFDRRRVVNTGSVGMPYGHGGASWALVDEAVTLRRTSYDARAAAARVAGSGMPGAADFARDCVLATSGDAEALDAFRPVVERQRRTGVFDVSDPA